MRAPFCGGDYFSKETLLKDGERIIGFKSRGANYAFHYDFQFIIGKMEWILHKCAQFENKISFFFLSKFTFVTTTIKRNLEDFDSHNFNEVEDLTAYNFYNNLW